MTSSKPVPRSTRQHPTRVDKDPSALAVALRDQVAKRDLDRSTSRYMLLAADHLERMDRQINPPRKKRKYTHRTVGRNGKQQ